MNQNAGSVGNYQTFFPKIFDKTRLKNGEFDKYIYEIPFKVKGGGTRTSRGMTAAGLIRAIHPYLESISSEIIHYGSAGEGRKLLTCVVRVTITICVKPDGENARRITVQAIADGDVTGVPSADTLVRTVETRAMNRALERLLDLSKADLNSDSAVDEEEHGTPLSAMFQNQIAKKNAERNRIAEEEGEDIDTSDENHSSDNKKSEKSDGSSKDQEDDGW